MIGKKIIIVGYFSCGAGFRFWWALPFLRDIAVLRLPGIKVEGRGGVC